MTGHREHPARPTPGGGADLEATLGLRAVPEGWEPTPGDPVVVRLEQLAAQLPMPGSLFSTLESDLLSRYAERVASDGRVVRRGSFVSLGLRRLVAVGLALLVALASVAAVAAETGPGQPFYRVRLAFEDLTLPPPGSHDRLDAQLRLLAARLSETASAAAARDTRGVADAASAYADRVAAAVDDFVAADAPMTLAGVLARQHAELEAIAADAPPAALPAVAGARRAVTDAQDRLAEPVPPPCASATLPPSVQASATDASAGPEESALPVLSQPTSAAPPTASPAPCATPADTAPARPTGSPGTEPGADPVPRPTPDAAPTEVPSPTPRPAGSPTPAATPSSAPSQTPSQTGTPMPADSATPTLHTITMAPETPPPTAAPPPATSADSSAWPSGS